MIERARRQDVCRFEVPHPSALHGAKESLHVLGRDDRAPVAATDGRDGVDVRAPRSAVYQRRQIVLGDVGVHLVKRGIAAGGHSRGHEDAGDHGVGERHAGHLGEQDAE